MTATALEFVLGPVTEVPLGEGRTFQVTGNRIAVFRTRNGEVFATQAVCPHKGGPLADGLLGGNILICPLHTWKFDLSSGSALMGNCGLKTYPIRINNLQQLVLTVGVAQESAVVL